jgi:hypothetical protein
MSTRERKWSILKINFMFVIHKAAAPRPPSAHQVTFWQEKKVSQQKVLLPIEIVTDNPLQTQRHNLSNNYIKM